jgi:fumarate hydratase subunit beta
MTKEIYIRSPLRDEDIEKLRAGDSVRITGTIYTARDAAHARMAEMIRKGIKLPFDPDGQVIYYTGPCPARPGSVIGPAGPTTSGRMDLYTPMLLDLGLKGMIGKGNRSRDVVRSIIKNKAVYFAAIGGIGALLSKRVKDVKEIDFKDLGTESIKELLVEDFPCIVAIDAKGNNIYENKGKDSSFGEINVEDFTEYLASLDNLQQRKRMEEILNWVAERFPDLEPKIAWNQPMFIEHGTFIIGFSTAKNHLAIAPERAGIDHFSDEIVNAGYDHSKQLVRIPWDDPVDFSLIGKIIEFNILDKAECTTFWRK